MTFQVLYFDDAYNVVTNGGSDIWASVPVKNRSKGLFKDLHYGEAKAEALEAAELLKAFFEAKQEGKDSFSNFAKRVSRHGQNAPLYCCVLKGKNPVKCQFDGCPTKEAQTDPFAMSDTGRQFVGGPLSSDLKEPKKETPTSDYQLRLERYAVDIYPLGHIASPKQAIDIAAEIMALAAEKSREQ